MPGPCSNTGTGIELMKRAKVVTRNKGQWLLKSLIGESECQRGYMILVRSQTNGASVSSGN